MYDDVVAALLLRDLLLFCSEVFRLGNVGTVFLPVRLLSFGSDTAALLLVDRCFSGNTGSLGIRVRTVDGTGTVCDLLLVLNDCTMFGDAEDHEIGVVAAVDALHGLEDAVN